VDTGAYNGKGDATMKGKREPLIPPGEDYTKLSPAYLIRVIENRDAEIGRLRAEVERLTVSVEEQRGHRRKNEVDRDEARADAERLAEVLRRLASTEGFIGAFFVPENRLDDPLWRELQARGKFAEQALRQSIPIHMRYRNDTSN
jgi:hypothetical protein